MIINQNLELNRYEWASFVINNLAEHSPVVYDIGAKDSVILNSITKDIIYKGFDLNPEIESIHKWDLNFEEKDLANTSDYVLLLEVVEHLTNPWNCISNLAKVLKPGGKLILTTPNPFWSESRVSMFFKGEMPCFTISDLELNHHVFTPWPHIIERLLGDNGFIIEKCVTLDGKTILFDANLTKNPFRILKRLTKKLLERNSPITCGMSYGIIAKKL
jgi:SAM-dependent methyltransferase